MDGRCGVPLRLPSLRAPPWSVPCDPSRALFRGILSASQGAFFAQSGVPITPSTDLLVKGGKPCLLEQLEGGVPLTLDEVTRAPGFALGPCPQASRLLGGLWARGPHSKKGAVDLGLGPDGTLVA